MNIEIGTTYKARDGQKVKIVAFVPDGLSELDYYADNGFYYNKHGRAFPSNETPHDTDLLSIWQETIQ